MSGSDQSDPWKVPRVLFCCSGVGILNRGIETFFREAVDGFGNRVALRRCCSKGPGSQNQASSRCGSPAHQRVGKAAGRLGATERLCDRAMEHIPPDRIPDAPISAAGHLYSDSNLGFLLHRFRRQIGGNYRLLFSNGGPCHPPFSRHDFVHQVAPAYYEEALAAGEPREKHFSIPYGIQVPKEPPRFDSALRCELRRSLGLPLDRPIVLSVGWIAKQHKRMHYLIEEVARMPKPRPFLQLVGAMDSASAEIVGLGRQLLGVSGFAAGSVSPDEIANYYRAADVFALASLQEGFGRVYLEALMHGLPVIAHRHPVMEYVIGKDGTLANLSCPGSMTATLNDVIHDGDDDNRRRKRWESVGERFSWRKLASDYVKMFQAVSYRELPNAVKFCSFAFTVRCGALVHLCQASAHFYLSWFDLRRVYSIHSSASRGSQFRARRAFAGGGQRCLADGCTMSRRGVCRLVSPSDDLDPQDLSEAFG